MVTFCTSTNEDVNADVGCVPAIPVLKNVATAKNADGIARFSSLWSHNLSPNESARFVPSFSPSSDVFASSTSERGRGSIVRQTINTNDARLIKQPPYRFALNAVARGFPSCLIFGRAPRLPLDASLLLPDSNVSTSVSELRARLVTNLEESRKLIASNTQLAQQRMKLQNDKHATPVPFDVGSKVWVCTPKSRKGLSKSLHTTSMVHTEFLSSYRPFILNCLPWIIDQLPYPCTLIA